MGPARGRAGDRIAIVDELGELTFAELDERTNRLCNAWRERGLEAGDGVALLARNHRGLLEASFVAFKAGARLILLNSDFAAPQILEVSEREGARLLIHDDEWSECVKDLNPPLGRLRAWADAPGEDTLASLIARGDPSSPKPPRCEAKLVLLTSGTTGTPKGAPRTSPKSLLPSGGLFDKVPFRTRDHRGRDTDVPCARLHARGASRHLGLQARGAPPLRRRGNDRRARLVEVPDVARGQPGAARRSSGVAIVAADTSVEP